MSDRDIEKELAAVADEAEAHRDDAPRGRLRSKRPPRDPSQVYSIRIPVDRLEELRRHASERGAAPTALMRKWVLERLDEERSRGARQPIPGVFVTSEIRWNAEITAATAIAAFSALDRIEAFY